MEATEANEFSQQMKEAGEAGMRNVSFAISVFAVLVAMVTVVAHRTHTEAILMQTRAADQWNLYQAKKIRQVQVSTTSDLLSLQPSSNDAAVQKKLAEYRSHLDKWNGEISEEQKEAVDLEHEVDRAEKRADRYDLGEALLEISVVLSSITLLTRRRRYFFLGALFGLSGLIAAATALLVH
jgi:Domain of unknown function (DUF4337)